MYRPQALQKRLNEVEKSTETLSERLDKAREENDDLRFQVSRAAKMARKFDKKDLLEKRNF